MNGSIEELSVALQNLTIAVQIYGTLKYENEELNEEFNLKKAWKYVEEKESEANAILHKYMKNDKVRYYGTANTSDSD